MFPGGYIQFDVSLPSLYLIKSLCPEGDIYSSSFVCSCYGSNIKYDSFLLCYVICIWLSFSDDKLIPRGIVFFFYNLVLLMGLWSLYLWSVSYWKDSFILSFKRNLSKMFDSVSFVYDCVNGKKYSITCLNTQ